MPGSGLGPPKGRPWRRALVVSGAAVVVAGVAVLVAANPFASGGDGRRMDAGSGLATTAAIPSESDQGPATDRPGGRPSPAPDLASGDPGVVSRPQGLSEACTSRVDDNGVGQVTVAVPTVIADQSLDIGLSCRITIGPGASLTLSRVQLRSRDLYLGSDENGSGARLVIEDSQLSGQGPVTLAMYLPGGGDRAVIANSRLDYDQSVVVAVSGAAPATVELSDTVLRSVGDASEGVQVIARELRYQRLSVEAASEDKALVVADHCAGEDMRGVAPRCKARS